MEIPETYMYKQTELPKGDHRCLENRRFAMPARSSARHRYIKALCSHLTSRIGDDDASRASIALDEALMNAEKHAHKEDGKTKAYGFFAIFDHYILLSVQTQGEPWDVQNVRLSCTNEDGSVHMGTSGRGHVFMGANTDQFGYSNFGREWYGIVKRNNPTN